MKFNSLAKHAIQRFIILLATGQLLIQPPPAAAQMSSLDMLHYVVQSVHIDSSNRVIKGMPLDNAAARFQYGSDSAFYRKHDWPATAHHDLINKGYQASDSVLDSKGAKWIIVQTFDFGDSERKFGIFDGSKKGDGGQLLMIVDGTASFFMTEDGGDGVQWFIGKGCKTTPQTERKFISWICFRYDIRSDRWTDVVAWLNKTRLASACPTSFNPAYTRYRLADISVPFRIVSETGTVKAVNKNVSVIVSEHYGGSSIAQADHLERFYFGKDLGMIRWERWENKTFRPADKLAEIDKNAADLANSGRVPTIEYSIAPGPNWRMLDSRTWTTMVPMDGKWKVNDYQWPEPAVLNQL